MLGKGHGHGVPGLGAGGEDVPAGVVSAWVIQAAGAEDRQVCSDSVHQEHRGAAIWAESAAHIVAFVGFANETLGLRLGDSEIVRFHADRCPSLAGNPGNGNCPCSAPCP